MKPIIAIAVGSLVLLLKPYLSYGQQAEAPVYKEGEWWEYELKVERSQDDLGTSTNRLESGRYRVEI